jgi:hypothetical protein
MLASFIKFLMSYSFVSDNKVDKFPDIPQNMSEIKTLKIRNQSVRYLHYPLITNVLEVVHPHRNITNHYPDEVHEEKKWCFDRGRMNPFLMFWHDIGWVGLTEEGYYQMKLFLPHGEASRITDADINELSEISAKVIESLVRDKYLFPES